MAVNKMKIVWYFAQLPHVCKGDFSPCKEDNISSFKTYNLFKIDAMNKTKYTDVSSLLCKKVGYML